MSRRDLQLFRAERSGHRRAVLITKSFWALLAAGLIHMAGYVACLKEPRIFDLWLTRVIRCPRVKNFALWGCNSYRP